MSQEIKLYVIRHGEARGNLPDDPLTTKGEKQAEKLTDFLLQREEMNVERLISSPYLRARQTAKVLAERLNINCSIDNKLRELDFGNAIDDVDLREQLKEHFQNFSLKFEAGESNQEVM